jgi:hypothetical protein
MIKRLFLLLAVMLTASLAFAEGHPTGGNGAQAAEDETPQQRQKIEAKSQEALPGRITGQMLPLPEKMQQRIDKIGQKLEKRYLRQPTKDNSTSQIPEQVRWWLVLGVIFIVAALVLRLIFDPSGFLGGLMGALGFAGFVCLVIALILFLMNYA